MLSWSSLKAGEGAKLYESFRKNLGRSAKAAGFFKEDPNKLSATWAGIGGLLIGLVVVFAFIFLLDFNDASDQLLKPGKAILVAPVIASVLLGVFVIIFSGRLVARTLEGAQALGMALAYRNTLRWELKRAHSVDEAVTETQSKLPVDHDAGPADRLGGRVRPQGRDRRPDPRDVRGGPEDRRDRVGAGLVLGQRRHRLGLGNLASSIGSISTTDLLVLRGRLRRRWWWRWRWRRRRLLARRLRVLRFRGRSLHGNSFGGLVAVSWSAPVGRSGGSVAVRGGRLERQLLQERLDVAIAHDSGSASNSSSSPGSRSGVRAVAGSRTWTLSAASSYRSEVVR